MFSPLPSRVIFFVRIGLVLLVLFSLGYVCWGVFNFLMTNAPYYGEEGGPLTRPEELVFIDLSPLPAQPNEQDFATLAQSVMERETHLQGFHVQRIFWDMTCGTGVHTPTNVGVSGQWQGIVDANEARVVPATIKFDFENRRNTISLLDYTIAKGPTHPINFINLQKVQWHVSDVFALVESQGGRDYRQKVQDNCKIFFSLNSDSGTIPDEWYVRYAPSNLEMPGFCARVHSQTGVYLTGYLEDSNDGCGSVLFTPPPRQ